MSPRLPPRRFEGKKVALALATFFLVGTAVATTIAYFGHQVGAVARERFEAARAEER